MRSWKRLLLITGMVGILVLTMAVVSILLRPPAYPSITLEDGRIFSFAGVSVGKEPYLFLERTSISRVIWQPVVSMFPHSQAFFGNLGIDPPWYAPSTSSSVKNDDITFWIQTKSFDKPKGGDFFADSNQMVLAGINLAIHEGGQRQILNPKDIDVGLFTSNGLTVYYSLKLTGLQKNARSLEMVLSQKNVHGVLEELATWEVEIP